jgi:ribosomal-protein-serine acetyltransferase
MAERIAVLPERLESLGGLLLRRWVPDDAETLGRAVAESAEHLRPWMAWIEDEPLSLRRRRAMIMDWERDWANGGDVFLGIFVAGEIAGSCGLHRRIDQVGLEIGYWVHPAFLRRGLATEVASVLTDAALRLPGITHVEIHHDTANRASAGVPGKLGYRLIGKFPDGAAAPAESGTECRWRIDEQSWQAHRR